ncbi:Phospholipase [Dirofilaria immitis]
MPLVYSSFFSCIVLNTYAVTSGRLRLLASCQDLRLWIFKIVQVVKLVAVEWHLGLTQMLTDAKDCAS